MPAVLLRSGLTALAAGLALASPLVLAGCGRHKVATPGEARLENEDFLALVGALRRAAPQVQASIAASKAAWPAIRNGIHSHPGAVARARIDLAAQRAGEVPLPALATEQGTSTLTGPASPLAGRFRYYRQLAARSWQLIASSLQEIEQGPAAAGRFARTNLPLYVESVYDAHFTLAQTGKQLLDAYKTLGAAKTFGNSLTEGQLEQLASIYSEQNARLKPKERVALGS